MKAAIALGSNLEPRLEHLQAAWTAIVNLHVGFQLPLCSRIYETSPVGCPDNSPSFLNAVGEIRTTLSPQALLAALQDIEITLGRPAQHGINTPRTIDLDLLYCDKMALSDANLEIPHPRLAMRQFVLKPLSDIRPTLVLPGQTQTIQELAQTLITSEKMNVYSGVIC